MKDEIAIIAEAISKSIVTYPDGLVSCEFLDWFDLDCKDAFDFGVLVEPKWHSYSDIAIMEHQWYVETILLSGPLQTAIKALSDAGYVIKKE